MTDANVKNQLASDPGYAIGLILANNPEEVVERLHAVGYKVTSADDCWAAINDLIRRGNTQELKYVLSVPFIAERADPELAALIGQVSGSMSTKSTSGQGIDAQDIFGGLATGILYTLGSANGQLNRPGTTGASTPPAPTSQQNNTMLWLGIAGAVVVLILLVLLLRKK